MTNSTFPTKPELKDDTILLPSREFKSNVIRCILAITFFLLIYILLITLGGYLAYYCFKSGLFVIKNVQSIFGIILGLGVMITGGLILFFLFKFLFKNNKVDRSGMTLITEADQPDLIQFIHRVADEAGTARPKNIYLVPDVNAFVFYDSNFLSLFWPVRKNLAVGIGLVNSINISEFKFILAHEFGHFSQRSMKLGTYVYQVNRIIFNLVGENEGFYSFLRGFAELHIATYLFAQITHGVIKAIQWVLQKMYQLINLSYLALSRQMEFHADTVAVSLAGSSAGITSMRKLELSDFAYQNTVSYLNSENLVTNNIYGPHAYVLNTYYETVGNRLGSDWTNFSSEAIFTAPRTAIVVKDQWASHPPSDERIAHMRKLDVESVEITVPAWTLIKQQDQVSTVETKKLVTNDPSNPIASIELNDFIVSFEKSKNKNTFDKRYGDYYDFHSPWHKNTDEYKLHPNALEYKVEELFQDSLAQKCKKIIELESDIETLGNIKYGIIPIKRFEFRGEKYKGKEADRAAATVQLELEDFKKEIVEKDERIYSYFHALAARQSATDQLKERYMRLKEIADHDLSFQKTCHDIQFEFGRIQQQHNENTAHSISNNLVRLSEGLRKEAREILESEKRSLVMNQRDKDILTEFIAFKGGYFLLDRYAQDALGLLNYSMQLCLSVNSQNRQEVIKELLEFQINLLPSAQ